MSTFDDCRYSYCIQNRTQNGMESNNPHFNENIYLVNKLNCLDWNWSCICNRFNCKFFDSQQIGWISINMTNTHGQLIYWYFYFAQCEQSARFSFHLWRCTRIGNGNSEISVLAHLVTSYNHIAAFTHALGWFDFLRIRAAFLAFVFFFS